MQISKLNIAEIFKMVWNKLFLTDTKMCEELKTTQKKEVTMKPLLPSNFNFFLKKEQQCFHPISRYRAKELAVMGLLIL